MGCTNYLGVSGFSGVIGVAGNDLLAGCFYNRSSVRISDVAAADGTSNTLLFGESSSTAGAELTRSWMGTGAMPIAFGLPNDSAGGGWWHFSSRHPGIVQFCLCDGSVRGIRKGLTPGCEGYDTLVHAAAWHDGANIDLASISD